jgi:hypothetical protein
VDSATSVTAPQCDTSLIPDLSGVPLAELASGSTGAADEVAGILARVIGSMDSPGLVSVTSFSSAI